MDRSTTADAFPFQVFEYAWNCNTTTEQDGVTVDFSEKVINILVDYNKILHNIITIIILNKCVIFILLICEMILYH